METDYDFDYFKTGSKMVQTTLKPMNSTLKSDTHYDVPFLMIIGKRDTLGDNVIGMEEDENSDLKKACKDTCIVAKSYDCNRNDIIKKDDIVLIGEFSSNKLHMFSAKVFERYNYGSAIALEELPFYFRRAICCNATDGIALIEAHRNKIRSAAFDPVNVEYNQVLKKDDVSLQVQQNIFSKAKQSTKTFLDIGYIGESFKIRITSKEPCFFYGFTVGSDGKIQTIITQDKREMRRLTIDAFSPCTIKILLTLEQLSLANSCQSSYQHALRKNTKTIDYFYSLLKKDALVFTIRCEN